MRQSVLSRRNGNFRKKTSLKGSPKFPTDTSEWKMCSPFPIGNFQVAFYFFSETSPGAQPTIEMSLVCKTMNVKEKLFQNERLSTEVTATRTWLIPLQLQPPSWNWWSFSKPRRRRRRERHQTEGLMSRTMAVHVRFQSWYISLPSSAKKQREMIKFYVFWRTRTAMANFRYLLLKLNAVGASL